MRYIPSWSEGDVGPVFDVIYTYQIYQFNFVMVILYVPEQGLSEYCPMGLSVG